MVGQSIDRSPGSFGAGRTFDKSVRRTVTPKQHDNISFRSILSRHDDVDCECSSTIIVSLLQVVDHSL
jgi:hypothetical protein